MGLAEEFHQGALNWQERGLPRPKVMVVSGSGLGMDLGPPTHGPLPLTHLLPFPCTGVHGHALEMEIVEPLPGRPVAYFRGRIHAYQGYDAGQVVFAVRLGALMGCQVLVLSNASGALRTHYRPGDLVLVRDHVNLTGLNPLRGEMPADWGPQFPHMGDAYDPHLRRLAQELGGDLDLKLEEAVYAGVLGPSYETPAEIQMLSRLGADLVGMSTVLEVIAARHMQVRCLCVSVVANLGTGLTQEPLDHQEVLTAGSSVAPRVQALLRALIRHPGLL